MSEDLKFVQNFAITYRHGSEICLELFGGDIWPWCQKDEAGTPDLQRSISVEGLNPPTNTLRGEGLDYDQGGSGERTRLLHNTDKIT